MTRSLLALCLAWAMQLGADPPSGQTPVDPFELLRPCVTIGAADLARLDRGAVLVRTLPETGGNLAVFGARRVTVDGDRLVAWVHRIDQFKQGRLVETIARFSEPPELDDLTRLSLDEVDLETLRDCRPARCGVKLTAAEIVAIQRAIDDAGDTWRSRVNEAFRRLALDRVRAYQAGGQRALGQYADGRSSEPLDAVFSSLLTRSPCITARLPIAADYLSGYPRVTHSSLTSFFYWSKERFGAKPIVSATHVVIARGDARGRDAIVVGKQLFATHYINGSLNLTAVVGTGPGSAQYLVVLNRTNVDLLHGLFAGLTRLVIERRLKTELSEILDHLARRLESGPPRMTPGGSADGRRSIWGGP